MNASNYDLNISNDIEDPEWDNFVVESSGGHYSQSSKWAQIKAYHGWKIIRVIISSENRIVAGVQILIRKISPFINLAYISKGPLSISNDFSLIDVLIKELHGVCKINHVQYLAVQPPNDGEAYEKYLLEAGFKKAIADNINTPGTVRIDLTQDEDVILAKMKKNVRKNIEHSQRDGIITREGSKGDLEKFYNCLKNTSERKNFIVNTEEHFYKMWDIFSSCGCLRMFCADYGNEITSTLLVIAYKDTVITWRRGWTGEYGHLHPNDALYWEAIQWAKSHNYQYFDFGGIFLSTAKKIL